MTKVLVSLLGSLERHGWINPDLTLQLCAMVRDVRYETNVMTVLGCIPHAHARNVALKQALEMSVDWTIQIDNDIAPTHNPLNILANAPTDADVIGIRYGVTAGRQSLTLFPQPTQSSDTYAESPTVGGGMLFIRNTVWQKFPKGPWFTWKFKENSETLECEVPEDVSLCNLVRAAGMKVYVYQADLVSHYHTQDVTQVALALLKQQRAA